MEKEVFERMLSEFNELNERVTNCREFLLDEEKVKQIENVLKLLIMPKGLKAGHTLYECSANYQWLFYISILAVVYREDKARRRYETGILEICRKNFKTYTVGTLFLLLFLFFMQLIQKRKHY